MKKIFVISAILLGSLLACQKPSDTDNIAPQKFENATTNDDKPPRELINYLYSAELVSTKKKDKDNKIYESIGGEALYEYQESKAITYTFVTTDIVNNIGSINEPQSFSISGVNADPTTILNNVLNQ